MCEVEGSLAKQGLQEASMMVADLDSSYSVTEEGFLRIPHDFSVKKFHKLLSRVLVFAHSRRKQICDRLRTGEEKECWKDEWTKPIAYMVDITAQLFVVCYVSVCVHSDNRL